MEWIDIGNYHLIEIEPKNKPGDLSIILIKTGVDGYREIEFMMPEVSLIRDTSDQWRGTWSNIEASYNIVSDHGYLNQVIEMFLENLQEEKRRFEESN